MGNNLETNMKSSALLADLIEINDVRVNGYKKAIEQLREEDEDLRHMFSELILESHRHKAELSMEHRLLGGDPESELAITGQDAIIWTEMTAPFTGSTRTNILRICEVAEKTIQNFYDRAMATERITKGLYLLLADQKAALCSAYDHIRFLRIQADKTFAALNSTINPYAGKGLPGVT